MKGPNLKEGSECHTDIPYLVKDTPYPLVQLKEKPNQEFILGCSNAILNFINVPERLNGAVLSCILNKTLQDIQLQSAFSIRHSKTLQLQRAFSVKHSKTLQLQNAFSVRHSKTLQLQNAFSVRHSKHYNCKGHSQKNTLTCLRHYNCKGHSQKNTLTCLRHYNCKGHSQ